MEYIPSLHRVVSFFKTPCCCCCCYLENQNFQNFQTTQAFYIHKGTSQNSLSTTLNTARAWWTQIWFTPLVSWKEGLEYVKSLAHSLKLWCLGWEHERRRHVVRREESASIVAPPPPSPPPTSTTLSCAKAKCQKAALECWTEALEHPLPGKHCHFSDEQLAGEVRSFNKQIFPDWSMIGQAYYIVLS